ncbi:MAG: hypothetical protein AAGH68_05860 [Pseudomonadota bacterium]
MVTRSFILGAVALSMTACADKYSEPIKLPPHGAAVRANLTAQIINPIPPGSTVSPTDAAKTGLAVDAYRKGEVKDPKEAAGDSTTSDVE